jgi:AAA domain
MKINSINVEAFLGMRHASVDLMTPVTIFCGANASGKSSLQEGIRMALTGESARVSLKKDYQQLVTNGHKTGFVEVNLDDNINVSVTLPKGNFAKPANFVAPAGLPFVLNAQRFAQMEPNDRRAFLFDLMGLSASPAEIKKRLLAKSCNPAKVEEILPLLRSGFDAAHKEAQSRARDEKAAWRTITGEPYGDQKAKTWVAIRSEFDEEELADQTSQLAALEQEIAAKNQAMGALLATEQRNQLVSSQIVSLRDQGSKYASIADKLLSDENELTVWNAKVMATQVKVGIDQPVRIQAALTCPHCDKLCSMENGQLVDFIGDSFVPDPQALIDLPKFVEAQRLLERSVANGKRDLASADSAAKQIEALEQTLTAIKEGDISKHKIALDELTARRQSLSMAVNLLKDAKVQAQVVDKKTVSALASCHAVQDWTNIADALAPDGIPNDFLKEALVPFNDRLEESSDASLWMHVHVEPDMSIYTAEQGQPVRSYALLSESEKWRADAMLAEAVSHISKTKVIVLDRFDVLDLQGRGDLIAWLSGLAAANEINNALIFGTLKSLPSSLPNTVTAHWIESGVVGKLKEAA